MESNFLAGRKIISFYNFLADRKVISLYNFLVDMKVISLFNFLVDKKVILLFTDIFYLHIIIHLSVKFFNQINKLSKKLENAFYFTRCNNIIFIVSRTRFCSCWPYWNLYFLLIIRFIILYAWQIIFVPFHFSTLTSNL